MRALGLGLVLTVAIGTAAHADVFDDTMTANVAKSRKQFPVQVNKFARVVWADYVHLDTPLGDGVSRSMVQMVVLSGKSREQIHEELHDLKVTYSIELCDNPEVKKMLRDHRDFAVDYMFLSEAEFHGPPSSDPYNSISVSYTFCQGLDTYRKFKKAYPDAVAGDPLDVVCLHGPGKKPSSKRATIVYADHTMTITLREAKKPLVSVKVTTEFALACFAKGNTWADPSLYLPGKDLASEDCSGSIGMYNRDSPWQDQDYGGVLITHATAKVGDDPNLWYCNHEWAAPK